MSARISMRLDISEAHARRFVRTETVYVYEQASPKVYQECVIEIYEFLATRDHKTSKPYQELDWKRFYIKDAVPGKNYPPMNQNYQGTTVVAFEDDKVTKCLTKDKSGKYYKMPSDMAYSEWKKKDTGGMVTGGSRVEEPVIRKHKLDMDVEKELLAVRAAIQVVPPKFREAINSDIVIDIGKTGASQYDYENDILYVARGETAKGLIHEIGHVMENKMVLPEKADTVKQELKKMCRQIIL